MVDLFPGEIYEAFDRVGRLRPFVVMSRPELNKGDYFLAAPFTTARLEERQHVRSCVFFSRGSFGLAKSCVAQADALTVLRKTDLVEPPTPLGKLDAGKWRQLVRAMGFVVQAECHPAA